ncbi:hypothetical protein RB213_001771 [Colletotrichum asianum]|uniref:Uncharacterized protein n=1 Tax=Colletotrichum asianum TaxID=702518 RepID=A0A8H3WMN4_9PEZI|nr:hypothetical protein GQ607_003324 [Colletotrichum asianum]
MVKFNSIISILALGTATVEACGYCQCHWPDGSHCCAVHANGINCDDVCKTAVYGVTNLGNNVYCNAGGSSNCISATTYRFTRAHCVVCFS